MLWTAILIALMVGTCIGCALMAVIAAGSQSDAYEAGYIAGRYRAAVDAAHNGR
jgi:hypothetical protein